MAKPELRIIGNISPVQVSGVRLKSYKHRAVRLSSNMNYVPLGFRARCPINRHANQRV